MSDLLRWCEALFAVLREPAGTLLDPGRRVYVPFLLCAGVLALATFLLRGLGLRASLGALASPRVWLHRSALADYKLIAARALLRAALFGAWGFSTLAAAAIVMGWLRRNVGLPGLHAAPLLVGALYTVALFVLEDWSRFYVHRAMHRVPVLWEFHKVHHGAEVLTPFTLYRTHPVEALLNGARNVAVVGGVTGLFAWLFGPSLRAWELLGVDALGFLWTLAGANLRHSHVWLSYGPRVERWILSPAQHQVHHSDAERHQDRNFGTVLSLWDALAGSLYVTTPRREALRFGLPPHELTLQHTVTSMLFAPVIAAARRLLHAMRSPSRVAPRLALVALSLLSVTCTTSTERLDRTALLRSFGRCTTSTYARFQTAADALAAATSAYAQTPDDGARAAARTAWSGAIDVWERAELLRYGPAAGPDTLGGRNLRASIYAWPDVSRCLIEQQIVSRAYEGSTFANLPSNARGLATVEYLLFYAGADNACDPANAINAMGTWSAIPAEELTRRKAAYARAAAADVAAQSRALLAAWEPDGFLTQLVTAGAGSRLFATQQAALSAVAEAAFYLDTDVKDLRLATPLGLSNCSTATCPDALESQWADRGEQHLRNNLAGLRLLLEGCPEGSSLGFDDLLESAGAGALASQMRSDLNAADAAINALPGDSLSRALASDRASVTRVHDAIKEITDFLKMEFSATLQIRSQRVEGDND